MTEFTKKEIVVRSLKSLHKARVKSLFRLKALRSQIRELELSERIEMRSLDGIQRKMIWEVNTNSSVLGDKR